MTPRVTSRTLGAAHLYHDRKRKRYVVYRTAGGVSRRTSVRYTRDTKPGASYVAITIRDRLHSWPGHKLASFVFKP